MDAKVTREYLMINHTDSIYPFAVPVEYPVAGQKPSGFKIGVAQLGTQKTNWMRIPTDTALESYLPRMEWASNSNELIVQHLNRRQNQTAILLCDIASGNVHSIYHEEDSAWIDVMALWDDQYAYGGWDWIEDGNAFLWASEKDGWRHIYRISRDGKNVQLVTKGKYDVMKMAAIDEKMASFILKPLPKMPRRNTSIGPNWMERAMHNASHLLHRPVPMVMNCLPMANLPGINSPTIIHLRLRNG